MPVGYGKSRFTRASRKQTEGLAFESTLESDCAAVSPLVLALLNADIEIHCLRDLTRGGLASALVEIATAARVHIAIDANAIPVCAEVRGASDVGTHFVM